MAKLIVVLILVLAAVVLEAKPKKKFPPNKQSFNDADIAKHPIHVPNARHRGVTMIPTAFDARTKWPKCDSIKTIRDQGQCGTCWAVSATSVVSDRLCVASDGKVNVFISSNQAAGCTVPTQTGDQNCEAGGDPSNVYKYMSLSGLPTGGAYNSNQGCIPYQVGPSGEPPLTCAKKCTNSKYPTALAADIKIIDSYWINYQKKSDKMSQATIDASVNQMQTEIMSNGPITATIEVFEDFQEWEAKLGPYTGPKAGSPSKGGHAIRIIGWNKSPQGVSYWLIANSWGTDAGDNGVYWVQMGKNVVGIEQTISAPVVSMVNPCVGSSFCDTPIDQAVLTNIKDSKSPMYLFQGGCTQQVSVAGAKLAAVGPAVPIGKVFLGAPASPISSYIIQSDKLWLLNPSGQAGANCVQGTGSTKFTCGGGSGSGGGGAQTNFYNGATLTTWSYYPNNNAWIFNTAGQGKNIGTLLTDKFANVTAFLNLDGQKMTVFGKDAAGKAISGVMSYPSATQTSFAWVTQPGPTSNVLTCAK